MSESYESFGIEEVDDLLQMADDKKAQAALTRKPGAGVTAKKAPNRQRPKAAANATSASKAKSTPQRQKQKSAKRLPSMKDAAKGNAGLFTRTLNGVGTAAVRAGSIGWWNAAALLAIALFLTLVFQAWDAAPHRWQPRGFAVENSGSLRVPTKLAKDLLTSYPERRALMSAPDAARLADFRRHLLAQSSVAEVRSVALGYEIRQGQAVQVIRADLTLREPVLAVMLGNKRRASVDAEGVVLPPALDPPRARPVIWDLEAGGQDALEEVLAFWPLLSEVVDPEQIADIYLHGDLMRPGQRGIVIEMTNGVRVLWGRPGEDRYGVDREHKVEQIAHALAMQGTASDGAVIDARFGDARYVARSDG